MRKVGVHVARQPTSRFAVAIATLRQAGKSVAPAATPGAVLIDGKEMTMNEVISLSEQTPPPAPPR
jgi:hypothetical protein